MQLSESCLQKLNTWIDIENKSSDINNMKYAYDFLDQYIHDHGDVLIEHELVALIFQKVNYNDNNPDIIKKSVINRVHLLSDILHTNRLSHH